MTAVPEHYSELYMQMALARSTLRLLAKMLTDHGFEAKAVEAIGAAGILKNWMAGVASTEPDTAIPGEREIGKES